MLSETRSRCCGTLLYVLKEDQLCTRQRHCRGGGDWSGVQYLLVMEGIEGAICRVPLRHLPGNAALSSFSLP
jgi:hypothetical protein